MSGDAVGGGATIQPRSRQLIDQTTRLVEFLRDLARTRQPRTLNVASYDQVLWLADLPAGVDLVAEGGAGGVLLTIERSASEPPPAVPAPLVDHLDPDDVSDSSIAAPPLAPAVTDDAVRAEYDAWLQGWLAWADVDRVEGPRKRWYRSLAAIARRLEQQDDEVELVVATGLVNWQSPNGVICNHLVTTPVQVLVDTATGTLTVAVAAGASSRFGDRDLLSGAPGFDPGPSESIRQLFREEEPQALGDVLKDRFNDWRVASFDRCRPYEHTWDRPPAPTSTPTLTFSPALVLRKRDQSALIEYLDRMWASLTGPEGEAPLGLAQLLQPLEPEDRIAWLEAEGAASGSSIGEDPLFPKAANPEQAQIMERLKTDNGVVVQGPPGTGKTHTIANLIAALLARGQRVLVTSQKAQALRVLHRQLPDEIQQLCVSMTDLQRGGSVELDRSVAEISRRFDTFSPEAQDRVVAQLATRRRGELQRAAMLKEQIRSLREAETYQHPEIAPGYAGTLASIARQVREQETRFGEWMVVPIPSTAGGQPPLSAQEAGELRGLLATGSPTRRTRAVQVIPPVGDLPAAADVRRLVEEEAAARTIAADSESELSRRLSGLDEAWLESTQGQVDWINDTLDNLGVAGPQPVGPTWIQAFIADGFANRNGTVWSQLQTVAAQAASAAESLARIQLHSVVLPDLAGDGADGLAGQLTGARALREHLAAGNDLKKRFRPPVQKAVEPLLSGSSVDGVPISGVAQLDIVIDHLHAEQTVRMLAKHWATVGLTLDDKLDLSFRVARLVDAAQQLELAQSVIAVRDSIRAGLQASSVHLTLADLAGWRTFADSLQAVRLRVAADAATATLDRVAEVLRRSISENPAPPPELASLMDAVIRRDAEAFGLTLDALDHARVEQRRQLRAEELFDRLEAVHPGFAAALERSAADDSWDARLGVLPEAWAWAIAATFFDEQRQPGREAQLDRELTEALDAVAQATAELAAAEAWRQALTRMNATHAQALRAYQTHISDRGAGTGRYASYYERAAREAMQAARGAVPAWIMPIGEVLTTIPPDQNAFDVVIVDEASQASIEALFLLWLAPRVIVVGDDRQCTPSQVSHGELQPIFDRLEDYLRDIPEYLRTAFTPRSSLFSLLTSRFGSVIRLREHFRCMPEIIGWSSRQFYADQPLVPLRQYGAARLQPVRTTYVPGAFAEGQSSTLRNQVEAEALVDQLVACLDDPEYGDRDFGVVVLQGRSQVRLIEALLEERVPPDGWEARRLRVGAPPDFQGDERDVVFLSMVVADRPRAVTGLEMQRRFNVAASRAKDQLWLFHSVTPDLLSAQDLRRSLLTYCFNPPPPGATSPVGQVSPDERCQPFDSLFEQRVYLRIRDRGYDVIPQFEVNNRRIDLVVVGANGRLAVECDGDAWHSSPDQRLADIDREVELKRCGWDFWRVRESEFYFDPDRSLASLWTELDRRGIQPGQRWFPEGEGSDAWNPLDSLSNDEGFDELDDEPGDGRTPAGSLDFELATVEPSSTVRHHDGLRPSGPGGVGSGATSAPSAGASDGGLARPSRPTPAEVRAWARAQGLRVGDRGRMSPEVHAAWNQAHPERPV